MELGDQLRKLREERKMSQQDLADKLHVSRQAVYKWESNKGYPDIENLITLSEIFSVTIDEMIKKDDKLREKINVDEDKNRLKNPGFYFGFILFFSGAFADIDILLFIGLAVMIFYEELLKLFKAVFMDVKNVFKD